MPTGTGHPTRVRVAGIVLAAGRSRRMGSPKALLGYGGRTFVEAVLGALRRGGCDPLLVVVGSGGPHEEIARLAREAGAEVVVNPDPASEQLESLRVALLALPGDCEGAAVAPVDVPKVDHRLVASLLDAFRVRGAPLVLPLREDGSHGHPVLFARTLFPELLAGDPADGARSVVHAHLPDAVEVPVSDPAMLEDVDTPEDYRRLVDG